MSHNFHTSRKSVLTALRSLSRDNKFAVEKEQVIKLIRAIVQFGAEQRTPYNATATSRVPLSEPVLRAFIAVAEHVDGPFRQICVLTLAEIREYAIKVEASQQRLSIFIHSDDRHRPVGSVRWSKGSPTQPRRSSRRIDAPPCFNLPVRRRLTANERLSPARI